MFRSFRPDGALVNLYRAGDTLGGHKDDVEEDATWPLVSISLGCSGVFLVGGDSLDEAPLPVLLRPGTVVIMSGRARLAYHGKDAVVGYRRGDAVCMWLGTGSG